MIIVTGAAGQLGTDVILELKRRRAEHVGLDIADLDITDKAAVGGCFARLSQAAGQTGVCVIHCAAYTSVDKAEDERELCFRVNKDGTENIAEACRDIGAEMIYISTDYVFDGSGNQPIEINAVKAPLSAYGESKLAGELAVMHCLSKYYIVRTSWVYGAHGNNFVKTMCRLAQSNGEIRVVGDQTGSPTYTPDLARLLCDMALSGKYGVYHATNEGFCSWAQFACEIMSQNLLRGRASAEIIPISTDEYPTRARRPNNSRLSKACLDSAGFARLPPWQDALTRYFESCL